MGKNKNPTTSNYPTKKQTLCHYDLFANYLYIRGRNECKGMSYSYLFLRTFPMKNLLQKGKEIKQVHLYNFAVYVNVSKLNLP